MDVKQPDEFVEVSFAPSYENDGFEPNESPVHSEPPPTTTTTTTSSSSAASTTTTTTTTTATTPAAADKPSSSSSAATAATTAATSQNGSADLNRNRPHSASMISRKSTLSTRSHASLSPTTYVSEYSTGKMFSYKDGSLNRAVEQCLKIFNEQDGDHIGSWLLTEISHWDTEHEMLILLSNQSLAIVKYNFIQNVMKTWRKVYLKDIKRLQIADLSYPSFTLMVPRDQGAVRIHLGNPTFFQRWNPWCVDLPMLTFTHHPTIYSKHETDTVIYNADDFAESLLAEAEKVCKKEGRELVLDESPIVIESYASVISVIHNQNKLGFNLDRNGMEF